MTAVAPTAPLLEVRGLSVDMQREGGPSKRVVADVSFAVHEGEMVGIVGGSGSGKTTTLRAILKRLPRAGKVAGGEIVYRGQDLLALSDQELRRVRGDRIAIIVQNPIAALNPLRHVEDQIGGLARQHGRALSSDEIAGRLREVGIADPGRVLRAYPHELSGGMAQRVLIACAVALEPEMILADEPTSALDVTIQAQIMELLARLVKERDLAVVFVTHDIALVAEYCDRVVVMRTGEIVEQGPVSEVIHSPKHEYTRDLVDAARPITIDQRAQAAGAA
jgi:ABC-type glutathione transport system ATPase component